MANTKENKDKTKLSELKEAILKSKKSFLFVGFFSLFINLLMLTAPLYMLQLYDRVLTSRSEETLIMLTSLVVLLFITAALLEIVRSRVLIRIGNKMDSLLSTRIFNSIFEFANKQPGKASSQPLNDLTSIRQFMTGNGVFAFFDAPWIPIYIGVLFLFHPMFGYFAIFAAIVLLIITFINEKTSKEKLAEANTHSQASIVYVNSNIRNSEVIHAMGMSDNIKQRWLQKYYSFLHAQTDASDKAGVWGNISKYLRMLFQSLMLGLGGYLAINAEVSPGMMIAGSIIMGRALAPLDLLTNSWKQFSNARMAYDRVETLLEDFPEKEKPMELPSPKGILSLENIMVIPPNAQLPSIQGLNMNIEEGDIVGIVGPSAAGKSSLARAMLGLWPLKLGTVRIDGADINHWDKELLGKYVGYLPQDIEIFEGTVSENIARFSEVVPEKVIDAAKQAGVHEMILKLEGGYDTIIGANGSTLSGGQRQRIGFARALYDNPVLVVLDEPNSNLDEVGELALVKAINELRMKGTTVVLITHRPNVLQVTTKLAFMQEGKLQMFGPSQEVLAKLSAAKQENSPQRQNQKTGNTQQVNIPKISLSKPGA